MSDNDSSAYWAAARAPRYPHARYMQRAFNPAPPEPAEVSGITDIAAMDQAAYAANRDQLLGGVKPAGEFVGLDSPTGRTALSDDQMAALLPWRHLGTPPPAGRALDYEQAEAARYAQRNTSLATPNRYTTNEGTR